MSTTPKLYAICDANCRWETLSREQILTAIMQAINEGTISDIDAGFVQTIKTINGAALKFFVGTQAEYDALAAEQKQNLFAIITNDTTKEGLLNAITTLQTDFNEFKVGIESGTIPAARATIANKINRNEIWSGYEIVANNTGVTITTTGSVGGKFITVEYYIQDMANSTYGVTCRTIPVKFSISTLNTKDQIVDIPVAMHNEAQARLRVVYNIANPNTLIFSKQNIATTNHIYLSKILVGEE